MRTSELTTPALLVDASRLRAQHPHHGRCPAGTSAAPARQGAQVHRAGRPAGGGGSPWVHLRHRRARWRGWPGRAWARTSSWRTRSPTRTRLGALARAGARVTVAVDSEATIEAAAAARVPEVVIDVNVGLPSCGCRPEDAGPTGRSRPCARPLACGGSWATRATSSASRTGRTRGRHARRPWGCCSRPHERGRRRGRSRQAGTGTYDLNSWATEIQAGSYALMDTAYGALGLPFAQALRCWPR